MYEYNDNEQTEKKQQQQQRQQCSASAKKKTGKNMKTNKIMEINIWRFEMNEWMNE